MHRHELDRRAAMITMGGLAAVTAAGCARSASGARGIALSAGLGYDPATGEYTLLDLPYPPDALEPHIDEQTMRIHHGRHHAAYVRGLNTALANLRRIADGDTDPALAKHWAREASFHGAGHLNHALFWTAMAPPGRGGGGEPTGPLADAISRDFGSHEAFVRLFKAASNSVEASGWGWLVLEPSARRLMVIQGEKQQDLMITGVIPLLGVDVWEHAYYLKYQNRRAEYVDNFMKVINWSEVARRYQAATA